MVFFILLVCGFLLVVASIYILIKTQKTKATVPNLKQTYKGILAIFLVGAGFVGAAFVIRWVDSPKSEEVEHKQNLVTALTFNQFESLYNKYSAEILNETITDWVITDSEKAATFQGEGYSFVVALSNDEYHYVNWVLFVFEVDENDDEAFGLNIDRMYALILIFEPTATSQTAKDFILALPQAGEEGILTESGATYNLLNVGGNGMFGIDLKRKN